MSLFTANLCVSFLNLDWGKPRIEEKVNRSRQLLKKGDVMRCVSQRIYRMVRIDLLATVLKLKYIFLNKQSDRQTVRETNCLTV